MARRARRFGFVLLILALLILGTYAVGFFLPDEIKGTVSLEIPARKEAVWAVLQDPEAVPVAGEMAKSVEPTRDEALALTSWVEDLGATKATWTVERSVPEGLQVRGVKDSVVPLTGTHELRLNEAGEGTRITVDYRYVVASGSWRSPLFRLLMGPVGGARNGVENYVAAVGKAAEAR